jgi:hypothetical protein
VDDDNPGNDGPSNNTGRRPLYDVYDAYDVQINNIETVYPQNLMPQENDSLGDSARRCSELSISSIEAHASHANITQDQQQKFALVCCYCSDFQTNDEIDYRRHVIQKHPGKPCYPSKADSEKFGLKAQGKDWET